MEYLTFAVPEKIQIVLLLKIAQELNKIICAFYACFFKFLLNLLHRPDTSVLDTIDIQIRAIRRNFLKLHIFRFILRHKDFFLVIIRVIMFPSQYQLVDGAVFDYYRLRHNVRVRLQLLFS